jgi:hypothetical protein
MDSISVSTQVPVFGDYPGMTGGTCTWRKLVGGHISRLRLFASLQRSPILYLLPWIGDLASKRRLSVNTHASASLFRNIGDELVAFVGPGRKIIFLFVFRPFIAPIVFAGYFVDLFAFLGKSDPRKWIYPQSCRLRQI